MTDERDHERARAERLAARDFVNSLPVRLDTSADLEQAIALTIDHRAQVRREALEEEAKMADGQVVAEQTLLDIGGKAVHRHGRHIAATISQAIRERARG